MLAKCTGNLWNCALEKLCLDTIVDGLSAQEAEVEA